MIVSTVYLFYKHTLIVIRNFLTQMGHEWKRFKKSHSPPPLLFSCVSIHTQRETLVYNMPTAKQILPLTTISVETLLPLSTSLLSVLANYSEKPFTLAFSVGALSICPLSHWVSLQLVNRLKRNKSGKDKNRKIHFEDELITESVC